MRTAVVLLSGGLDSAVAAYQAKKDVGESGQLHALSVRYGQRHRKELVYARTLGELLYVESHNFPFFSLDYVGSSLVHPFKALRTTGIEDGIPNTWVPQRNAIMLAMAFALAESVDADCIYTGYNIIDYSGYPDCRPEFVRAQEKACNLASKRFTQDGCGFSIITPLIKLSKTEIILLGQELGVPWENTWSCYSGEEKACGVCDSCRIRLRGFKEAGLTDPIPYKEVQE